LQPMKIILYSFMWCKSYFQTQKKMEPFLLPILSHVFCFKSKGSGILNPQRYSSTGFLSRILWCSQSGNHSQINLAKFGYILDVKVGKKTELCYILSYVLELIIKIWQIKKKILQKFGEFGSFFPWKFLV